MVNKNKKQSVTAKLTDAASVGGIVLMAAAATLGLVELPHDPDKRAIVPNNPVYAVAENSGEHQNDAMRRERDEVHPHYHGYGVSQRTPGRTGKI